MICYAPYLKKNYERDSTTHYVQRTNPHVEWPQPAGLQRAIGGSNQVRRTQVNGVGVLLGCLARASEPMKALKV